MPFGKQRNHSKPSAKEPSRAPEKASDKPSEKKPQRVLSPRERIQALVDELSQRYSSEEAKSESLSEQVSEKQPDGTWTYKGKKGKWRTTSNHDRIFIATDGEILAARPETKQALAGEKVSTSAEKEAPARKSNFSVSDFVASLPAEFAGERHKKGSDKKASPSTVATPRKSNFSVADFVASLPAEFAGERHKKANPPPPPPPPPPPASAQAQVNPKGLLARTVAAASKILSAMVTTGVRPTQTVPTRRPLPQDEKDPRVIKARQTLQAVRKQLMDLRADLTGDSNDRSKKTSRRRA